MVKRRLFALVFFAAMLPNNMALSADLGVLGRTYPIAERDALEEIQSRAAKVDWKRVVSKIKPENFRPEGMRDLPRATKDSVRSVDVTYVLDADIVNGRGEVLYPAGYTFNPLDYIPFTKTIVIFNGEDRDQVAWFKGSEYAKRIDVMPLLSRGGYVELAKSIGRPVFYSDYRIVSKFQVRAVPSVIKQSGRAMEVREIYVPKSKVSHKP